MARLARIIVPGIAHHVTQRGNRREPIFFEPGDQEVYRDLGLLPDAEPCASHSRAGGCARPRPRDRRGAPAIHELHQRARTLDRAPFPKPVRLPLAMDAAHLIAAVRYMSLNPVRARFVARAEDWAWSSVRAHLARRDDGLVTVKPMLDRFDEAGIAALLRSGGEDEAAFSRLRGAETTGRPLGNADFIAGLERLLGRPVARRAPGRKAAQTEGAQPNLL